MNDETMEIIKGYPGISEADAKLIFIRQSGRDAFKNRCASLESILPPTPVSNGNREQVIQYISYLETYIKHLKAFQQGLEIEYANEVEPEIKENYKQREAEKDAKRSIPQTKDGAIKKALMGINKEDLIAALRAQIAREKAEKESK
jgi:hypothetical protein